MEARIRQTDRSLFGFKPPPGVEAEWFRLDDISVHRLPDQRALLVNRVTGGRGEIPAGLLPILNYLQTFRTVPEHVQALQAQVGHQNVSSDEIGSILNQLKAAGLLVAADRWLERVEPGKDEVPAPWVLVFTTCDRPVWFERTVRSTVPHLSGVEPPSRILIIDDSREKDARARNRGLVDEYLGPLGHKIEHWDRTRRREMAKGLANRMANYGDAVRWLLDPEAFEPDAQTFGQVRNLTTLLTVGERYLTIDDDCLLEPLHQAHTGRDVRFSHLARQEKYYPDADALRADTLETSVNPIAEHLAALGRHPFSAMEALDHRRGDLGWLRAAQPVVLDHLTAGTRIGATRNGLAGDPGTADMLSFYAQPGDAAHANEQLMDRHQGNATRARTAWVAVPQPSFYFASNVMSVLLGFDNRNLIPCAPPVGRGSNDDVLGAVFAALHPDRGRFEFPWALPHRMEAPSKWERPEQGDGLELPPPEEMLNDIIKQYTARIDGPDVHSRSVLFQGHFRKLADSSDAELRAAIEESRLDSAVLRLRMLASNRANPSLGGPFATDLRTYAENLEGVLARPVQPGSAWVRVFRGACRAFADSLAIWPSLANEVRKEASR